jgi:2-dehydro-3-deoxygalactonokinase
MSGPVIGLDWGSSRLRAFLIDASGQVAQRRTRDAGAIGLDSSAFDAVLVDAVGDWAAAHPSAPIIACGMVGARGGWIEAGYVDLPAGVHAIRDRLARVDTSLGRPLSIVSGLRTTEPDVVRGEETQALGTGLADGLLCMPGTHSKWLHIRAGTIESFRTWFTGELFDLLGTHGSLAKAFGAPSALEPIAFAAGVAASIDGSDWLHQLFGFRARVVGADANGADERARLSGWLIGTELRQALDAGGRVHDGVQLMLVADPRLAALYEEALSLIVQERPGPGQLRFERADPDCAAHGLFRIATGR